MAMLEYSTSLAFKLIAMSSSQIFDVLYPYYVFITQDLFHKISVKAYSIILRFFCFH